jgi:glycosyltransferase involved in cell wall biosynthesis
MREWVIEAQSRQNWPMPPVTVAVPTRDRAEVLEECIAHLQKLDYPNFEILIVDNSNDPVPAREIAERMGARYVRCSVPGASRARNMAIEHANHEWVAFTDDDCRPESNWLKELVRPIQDSNCRCVCGLVLAAQLENAAEITFEIYGGLGRGYAAKVFDRGFLTASRTKPAPTWNIGASANMLLHRHFTQQIGGFDIDMGPGPYSVGGCGEDTDIYYQALRRGFNVHYAPRAIVHHLHRGSPKALRKQISGYAVGHAAYHTRCLLRYGDYRSLLQLIWHLPRWFARNLTNGVRGKTKYPFSLVLLEIRGTAVGPFQYLATKTKRLVAEFFGMRRGLKPVPSGWLHVSPRNPPPVKPPHMLIYDDVTGQESQRAA